VSSAWWRCLFCGESNNGLVELSKQYVWAELVFLAGVRWRDGWVSVVNDCRFERLYLLLAESPWVD
jgi:hypothetical protein